LGKYLRVLKRIALEFLKKEEILLDEKLTVLLKKLKQMEMKKMVLEALKEPMMRSMAKSLILVKILINLEKTVTVKVAQGKVVTILLAKRL
jgi:hypothetical protein